ncbi:MAG: hypothetical protein ACPLPR_05845 [Bacillota bacterium]
MPFPEEGRARLAEAYLQALRPLAAQPVEAVDDKLRQAAKDLLDLLDGKPGEEVIRRRIGFGRNLHAWGTSLKELVASCGLFLGSYCDELAACLAHWQKRNNVATAGPWSCAPTLPH